MPPIALEVNIEEKIDGKVYERSQEDGELYAKPTIGIIHPPPEVRSILSKLFVVRT